MAWGSHSPLVRAKYLPPQLSLNPAVETQWPRSGLRSACVPRVGAPGLLTRAGTTSKQTVVASALPRVKAVLPGGSSSHLVKAIVSLASPPL